MGNQPGNKAALDAAVEALLWSPSHTAAFAGILSEMLGAADKAPLSFGAHATTFLDATLLQEWAPTYKGDISRKNAKDLLTSLEGYVKSKIGLAVEESSKLDLDASSFKTLKGHGLEKDWLLWQHPAAEIAKKIQQTFPEISKELLRERAQLGSLRASKGGIFTFAYQAHVLFRLDEYFKFESSIPSAKEKANASVFYRLVAEALPDEARGVVENCNTVAEVHTALKTMVKTRKAADLIVPLKKEDAPKSDKKGKKDQQDKKGQEGKKEGKKDGQAPKETAAKEAQPSQTKRSYNDCLQYDEHGVAIRAYIANASAVPQKQATSTGVDKRAKVGACTSSGVNSQTPVETPNFGRTWCQQVVGQTNFSLTYNATAGDDFSKTFVTPLPQGHTPTSWNTQSSSSSAPTHTEASSPPAEVIPAESSLPEEVLQAAKKLDLRVGKIEHVEKAANADTLFLCQINIGGEMRQLVTGLVKFYKVEDLANRIVIVYCNIKPSKMAGYDSQSMLLSAVQEDPKAVELLDVPADIPLGTHVFAGSVEFGSEAGTVSAKNISKQWAKVQSKFTMLPNRVASLAGIPLTVNGQQLKAATLTNCEIR